MNIVSTPIPGFVRSPFCVQTYEWLARRDGVEICPEHGMPLPKWGPVLLVSDVLEAWFPDPTWDDASDDLVYVVAAMWTDLAALESIAREVAAFRRWLAAEGLGSSARIDAIEALVEAAPSPSSPARGVRSTPTVAVAPPSSPRLHVPRRERRAAARAERKRLRRSA